LILESFRERRRYPARTSSKLFLFFVFGTRSSSRSSPRIDLLRPLNLVFHRNRVSQTIRRLDGGLNNAGHTQPMLSLSPRQARRGNLLSPPRSVPIEPCNGPLDYMETGNGTSHGAQLNRRLAVVHRATARLSRAICVNRGINLRRKRYRPMRDK